ncbi:ubiquinone biosynthesis protein COQ4 [Nostoc sp. UHCC 0870]|uniref:ubiquinone biosynthesis protein COQ4 n=1 Tax=Nostoc sp. UHCC 0870 TaxID=2914041 RepID=UPI001EE0D79F|nr:ubiquinone biosynthesis protein COQ4 [Nostoc sp. UHCC 0870]UKP01478.1 ubiquinone biosynthesis protein COQ4 [Nostoc sp. UHCC 0870]
MQPDIASPNLTPRLQQFLDILDRFTETRGKNVPQIVYVEKLRSLPPNTFGKTLVEFLDTHNLKPFTTGSRRKQLHDGVHVLTGYGADPIGEAEVQAFLLGAKFGLFNLLIGLGLLRMIHKNLNSRHKFTWERLWQAYQRGLHSNFDPDTWQPELVWHLPLTEVQAMFSVDKI